jgi:L-threonylcarbamoyladenylate synthase
MIVSQTDENLNRIGTLVTRGGVIAFRTDTFYGLGADPFNRSAIQLIKDLKGREDGKPILVLISDPDQIGRLIEKRTTEFVKLVERFWPGPLTIIGQAASGLPDELTAGTKTVGVRLPADDDVRELVRTCGGALTATSANPAGQAPARTAQAVAAYFGDRVDVVDGGAARTDQPSTVVEAKNDEVSLVREGVILWSVIQSALSGR